jgi:Flp pilus assembly protein TadG
VEFALVIVILFVVMLAIVELGRMLAMHVGAIAASREGARYGAAVGDVSGTQRYLHCDGIRAAARATVSALVTLADGDIVISYDDGPGDATPLAACPPTRTPADVDSLDRIVVQVTVTYQPITPMLQAVFGPITVTSLDRRTIVKAP